MGRIKTLLVKRVAHDIMELHGSKFTEDFEKNKEILNTLISTPSRKLKNVMAGYITRLVKKEKEPKKVSSIRSRYDNLEIYYK
jgi:small subunit ribosomal protein S17e